MLNISRSIYAGTQKANANELPHATVIPKGTTSGEKKKYERLVKDSQAVRELENIPLPGFTLLTHGRKSWSSSETLWTVIDPRGFTTSITSQNLEEILTVTGITEGLIQEKCVWARQDNNITLSLIPVNTPGYTEAATNTDILENKPKKKEIKIGDTVLLQNGLTGKFLGNVSLYGPLKTKYTSKTEGAQVNAMLKKDVVEIEPGKFFYATDSKMVKIIDSSEVEFTKDDTVESLNALIRNGKAYFTSNHHEFTTNYRGYRLPYENVCLVSAKPEKPRLKLVEIDQAEAKKILIGAAGESNNYMVLLEKQGGSRYVVNFGYNRIQFDSQSFVTQSAVFTEEAIQLISDSASYYYSRDSKPKEKLDNFTKFYKIEKLIGTESYI